MAVAHERAQVYAYMQTAVRGYQRNHNLHVAVNALTIQMACIWAYIMFFLSVCVQLKNIASLFKLEPTSVYLMEEIDSLVLFPLDDGKFKPNQLVANATYEPSNTSKSDAGSPFGVLTRLTYHGDVSVHHIDLVP